MQSDFWGKLAGQTFLTREYVKKIAYSYSYGGVNDPWLDFIVKDELNKLLPTENVSTPTGQLICLFAQDKL